MSAIESPVLLEPRRITDVWTLFPAWIPVPGIGVLPINSFLLKGPEPVLIDTGLGALGPAFMTALETEVDPQALRWIWLSHMDPDHVGNLDLVLERAPNAQILTNFLGMGKMGLAGRDLSRVHLLEPGRVFEAGEHRLMQIRPPYYDAPETIGFFDTTDGTLFVADSFGALLPDVVTTLDEVSAETLRKGLVAWSSIDAPWLTRVDRTALGGTLAGIEQLEPARLLSGHLPVATSEIPVLTRIVADAYCRGETELADPLSIEHLAATIAHHRRPDAPASSRADDGPVH
jgi:glyoxylase-like metal-dependent hydrolase (beta-lactamase superfamily II)